MESKTNVPKSAEALQRAFLSCEKGGRFKKVGQEAFSDYVERANKDLASAERDFEANDFHWARVKAYQSLFHLLNALLIKKLGYYSKDHGCIIVALMNDGIISEDSAKELHLLVDKVMKQATSNDVYRDLDEFRIQRNFALYKPKSWVDVKEGDVRAELDKIKNNFKILVSLL
ncbi:HEPN domain-containing protein [Candidatus Woesearchaeota archaeon]|nr:HEPN domain-containing protein [Candidatus Woesearchaeota archaeon]